MATLLGQCHEVLHEILSNVLPGDLSNLSLSCKSFHTYIDGNWLLWRDVYLKNFDNPLIASQSDKIDWEDQLKRITTLEKLLKAEDKSIGDTELQACCETISQLAITASLQYESSNNVKFLESQLSQKDNKNLFILASNLFDVAREQKSTKSQALSNALAKVHCLYGTGADQLRSTGPHINKDAPPVRAHPYARSRVYDLRLYTEETKWGPWSDDGSMAVDWEKVECIMIDLAFNFQYITDRTHALMDVPWRVPFKGAQAGSYVDTLREEAPQLQSSSQDSQNDGLSVLLGQPDPSLDALDPYGVTGNWQRIVCFLDYSDFYYFNFSSVPPLTQRRPANYFQEAIRLILMRLHVTKIEKQGAGDMPIVHFKGTSRSMHQGWDPTSTSAIKGTVQLTPEKEVRWSTISTFQGEARWRSEGVQVGGIRSGRGVFGNWFEKDHDENGPAGPTAMWKITDQIDKNNSLTWRRCPHGGIQLASEGVEIAMPDLQSDPNETSDDEWEEVSESEEVIEEEPEEESTHSSSDIESKASGSGTS
ncbi:hypothetical protein BT63DRAFT_422158 [Microthyrium microscopicum]|uniref:F-box domain-containing protein n=1 Tax=Microthyrium microscopicum TaxID=703497 RepID=A0A6A6UJH9_9PEZI|nr:hypothetical protein BT63DRAFT_422158 [Microthyrium microscopicum]